ncbi:hypothetical protein RFI_16373 [Reticulomyxa filosa]|uniref:Uncharacterized protein n=1 Tax=Reticulomyxa filosa TaxID=46433 RepID=X6N495_RETFI|nr:hypothetical protein RFI_16373 [Reticulomyxa filosa]|eukprot:ETO20836.1 hypothetical protein RFI_16373 [Reticulomyxa filosa]
MGPATKQEESEKVKYGANEKSDSEAGANMDMNMTDTDMNVDADMELQSNANSGDLDSAKTHFGNDTESGEENEERGREEEEEEDAEGLEKKEEEDDNDNDNDNDDDDPDDQELLVDLNKKKAKENRVVIEEEESGAGSSDEPLIKVETNRPKETIKSEIPDDFAKSEEAPLGNNGLIQKLSEDNREMKGTLVKMESKIQQLTGYRDSQMLSLRRQLSASNQRSNNAESKNVEYEQRIKFIEMESSKNIQQSLMNEVNALRIRLEMLQTPTWNNYPIMSTNGFNGNMPSNGFNGNMPSNWMNPTIPALQMPHLFNNMSPQMSTASPMTTSFPPMLGPDHTRNNFNLQPFMGGDIHGNGNSSALVNNHVLGGNLGSGGDGMSEMDAISDLGMKRLNSGLNRQISDWGLTNNNDDFGFLNSPFHSIGNMDIDMDIAIQ